MSIDSHQETSRLLLLSACECAGDLPPPLNISPGQGAKDFVDYIVHG